MPKEKKQKERNVELELLKGIAEDEPIHMYPFHTKKSGFCIASRGTIYRAKEYLETKGLIVLKETRKFRTGQDQKFYQLSNPIQQLYNSWGLNIFLKIMDRAMRFSDLENLDLESDLESAVSLILLTHRKNPKIFSPEEREKILKNIPPILKQPLKEWKKQIDILTS